MTHFYKLSSVQTYRVFFLLTLTFFKKYLQYLSLKKILTIKRLSFLKKKILSSKFITYLSCITYNKKRIFFCPFILGICQKTHKTRIAFVFQYLPAPDINIEDSSSNRSSKDNTSTSSKPASQSTRSASQTSSSSQISNVSSPNKSSKYGNIRVKNIRLPKSFLDRDRSGTEVERQPEGIDGYFIN